MTSRCFRMSDHAGSPGSSGFLSGSVWKFNPSWRHEALLLCLDRTMNNWNCFNTMRCYLLCVVTAAFLAGLLIFPQLSTYKCKKTTFIKNGYSRLSCTTAKNHRFITFVMYCFITTVLVAFYWARSDDTVHYKCDETVNFCGFRCASKSPITVFINVFYIYICCFTRMMFSVPRLSCAVQSRMQLLNHGAAPTCHCLIFGARSRQMDSQCPWPSVPSVLWHCWLGHLTRKNPSPIMTYNVFGGTLSLTQSINQPWPSRI